MELERQSKQTKIEMVRNATQQRQSSPQVAHESTPTKINIPPKKTLIGENSPILDRIRKAELKTIRENQDDENLIEDEYKDDPEVMALRAKNKTLQYASNATPLQSANIADYIESSEIPQTRNLAEMEVDFITSELQRESLDEPPTRAPLPEHNKAQDLPSVKKTIIDKPDLSDLLPNRAKAESKNVNPPLKLGSLGLITRESNADFDENMQDSYNFHHESNQNSHQNMQDSRESNHNLQDSRFDSRLDSMQNFLENLQNESGANHTPRIIDDIARSKNSDAIVGIYTPDPHDVDSESHHRVEFVDKIDNYDIEMPKNKTLYDNFLGENDIIDTTEDIDALNEINNSLSRAQKRLEEKIKMAKLRQQLGDIKSVTPIETRGESTANAHLIANPPNANFDLERESNNNLGANFSARADLERESNANISANHIKPQDLGENQMRDFDNFRVLDFVAQNVNARDSEEIFIDFSQNPSVDFSPNEREFSESNVRESYKSYSKQSVPKPDLSDLIPNAQFRHESTQKSATNSANFTPHSQDSRESNVRDNAKYAQDSRESNFDSRQNLQDSRESNDEYNENFFDLSRDENPQSAYFEANPNANQSIDSSPIQSTNYYTSQSVDLSPNQNYAMPNPHSTSDFTLPPLDLLNPPLAQKIDIDDSEIDIKVQNLFNKLRVFKIEGDIVRTYSGPVVTTFEFRPAPNVKVSRIQNLQDDLSMALKATSIRIQAPIPGKDVVGIEIPNNKIQTIYLREIFESDEYRNATANLPIALGKDVIGNPVIEDLAKLPHLLIAGTTGSGKSVGINAMILSLLYRHTPKDLRFIMIDPKFLEFGLYKDIPHLLTPIITDPKKAIIALSKAVEEMNRRYELMDKAKVKTIVGYNEVAEASGEEKLPYIVIIIDEFADLMIMGGREAEQFLISLAGKARASGIHLIIATQRPTVNVVTGLIKGNLPSKISYRVGSKIDSKVILDETGAEALLGRGDLLFSKTNNIVRLHAPYNDEREIERIVEFLKAQQEVQYDEFFSLEQKEPVGAPQPTQISSEGDYKERAKEIILQSGKTSISYLQRGLGVGFNKAASIIESLEKDGFLSPPNSKGVREIIGN